MNRKLRRKAIEMAKRRGLEDKLIYQRNAQGSIRVFNPLRNWVKNWLKRVAE